MPVNNIPPSPSPYSPPQPTGPSSPTAAPGAEVTALAKVLTDIKTALGAVGEQGATRHPGAIDQTLAGVSSFTPTSAPGSMSAPPGMRSAAAPDTRQAALASPPMGKAEQALAQEEKALQKQKHNFPEHLEKGVRERNRNIEEKNASIGKKIAKLDAEIAKGGDGKKLDKMKNERSKLEGERKPLFDPVKVTDEIDAVMNDPKLTKKDRKKNLEDIRKKYELKHNGGSLSMDTLTRHLSTKTKESKDRVGELRKTHMKQLDDQINQAKKTHGNNSPQVKALEEQKKGDNKSFDERQNLLGEQHKTLWYSFKKLSFGEDIRRIFKKLD